MGIVIVIVDCHWVSWITQHLYLLDACLISHGIVIVIGVPSVGIVVILSCTFVLT